MFDNLKKRVLLIGAGPMAIDYYKVLKDLNCNITVVGRSHNSAKNFEDKTGTKIVTGGLETFLDKSSNDNFDVAIVAVGVEQLAPTSIQLLKAGFKNILVEKPAGLNHREIKELSKAAKEHKAAVLIAYNRRFYASVLKALEIIENDGGVTSFHFEFTEWAHVIETLDKAPGVKGNWLLANSTHVIDMAFYMGGFPAQINSYVAGELSWHDNSVFAGAGKTKNGALFSYQANWAAPGRWGVEILTKNSRLIFRPLEELQIQQKGSVAINKVEIDNALDKQYKPGLFVQIQKFLNNDFVGFKTIENHAAMLDIYQQIAKGEK